MPFEVCSFLGQKLFGFQKWPKKQMEHSTCSLTSSCQRAFCCHEVCNVASPSQKKKAVEGLQATLQLGVRVGLPKRNGKSNGK